MNRRDFLQCISTLATFLWIQPRLLLERLFTTPYPQCIYVSPNGSDQNDGLSVETAKYTLSAALQAIGPVPCAQDTIFISGYYYDKVISLEDGIIALDDNAMLADIMIEGKGDFVMPEYTHFVGPGPGTEIEYVQEEETE